MIDAQGEILKVDPHFAAMLRVPAADLIGCNMLDFTAPADREQCIHLLGRLLEDGRPVSTTKRMIRGDGTHAWVLSSLTIADGGRRDAHIDGTIEDSAPPDHSIDPAELLGVARIIFSGRRKRGATFSSALFNDHAWDILLSAYISEAEGRALTSADMHAMLGISLANASRWMRALSAEGLLDYEKGSSTALVTASVRLSCAGHEQFERYLSELHADHNVPDVRVAGPIR